MSRSGRPSDPAKSFGPLQFLVAALCFAAVLADGFDTQAAAFAAPLFRAEFGGSTSALGFIFGMGMFGGFVGAFLFGSLGDRFGRRPSLLVTLGLMAIGSAATLLASDMTEIAALRFVTGLGLGGAVPNLVALAAEYAPPRLRSTVVASVFNGFPLGAMIGSIVGANLLPIYGWRALFLVGAGLPAIILVVAAIFLPESMQFLKRRGDVRRLDRIASRLGPAGAILLNEPGADPETGRSSIDHLFRRGLAVSTGLVWVTTFLGVLVIYCTVNWLPTLISGAGLPLATAILTVAALNVGSIVGAIILARVADRREPYSATASFYVVGGLFLAIVGYSTGSATLILAITLAAGLFAFGAQLSVTAITAQLYPTEIRATGVGWAFGIGRVGGVVGPIFAGFLLQSGTSFTLLMVAIGVLTISAGVAIFLLGRTGRAREVQAARERLRHADVLR